MVPPIVQTLLLCDHAIMEHGTRKISLIGLFENIYTKQFPLSINSYLYMWLSNGHGLSDIRARVMDLGLGQYISDDTFKVNFKDPMSGLGIAHPVRLTFNHYGTYELVLLCENEMLKTFKLTVVPSPVEEIKEKEGVEAL